MLCALNKNISLLQIVTTLLVNYAPCTKVGIIFAQKKIDGISGVIAQQRTPVQKEIMTCEEAGN